jgi:hypothetical protein
VTPVPKPPRPRHRDNRIRHRNAKSSRWFRPWKVLENSPRQARRVDQKGLVCVEAKWWELIRRSLSGRDVIDSGSAGVGILLLLPSSPFLRDHALEFTPVIPIRLLYSTYNYNDLDDLPPSTTLVAMELCGRQKVVQRKMVLLSVGTWILCAVNAGTDRYLQQRRRCLWQDFCSECVYKRVRNL